MSGRRLGAAAVLVLAGAGAFMLPQTGTSGMSSAAALSCDATSGLVFGSGPIRAPMPGAFTITSEYGARDFRGAEFHAGLDFATSAPVPVLAITAGTVTFAGPAGSAGNMVVIDHGNTVTTRSMHLASIAVRQGQAVAAGHVLGVEGTTGDSTGLHLHLEIKVVGATVNPRDWLTRAGVPLPSTGGWTTAAGAVTAAAPGTAHAQAPTGCSAAAVGLKSEAVPAAFAPWVMKAGTVCATVPAAIIAAQIETESGWNPRAVSAKGAQGPSQFMPGTWAAYGRDDDGNGTASPFDVGDAVMAQARYDCAIATLVGSVPGDRLDNTLAGYNAGPGAVLASGGIPSYAETRDYVARIKTLAASKYGAGGTAPR